MFGPTSKRRVLSTMMFSIGESQEYVELSSLQRSPSTRESGIQAVSTSSWLTAASHRGCRSAIVMVKVWRYAMQSEDQKKGKLPTRCRRDMDGDSLLKFGGSHFGVFGVAGRSEQALSLTLFSMPTFSLGILFAVELPNDVNSDNPSKYRALACRTSPI